MLCSQKPSMAILPGSNAVEIDDLSFFLTSGWKLAASTIIGIAAGNGRKFTSPADFDWFEYSPQQ